MDVESAISELRAQAGGWGQRPVAARAAILATWADRVAESRSELVAGLTADTGRLALSEMEVDSVLASVRRCSGWALEMPDLASRVSSDPGVTITDAPVPVGLVGVISPWNFPLQLALIDAVPALLAGCVVVVKPTEVCPSFVPALRATIEAVPELAAVLKLVEGGPEVGEAIVASVDAVCFTGSVRTGRRVAQAAAEAFIPANLELGGKDPAIVTADADLEIAASGVLWGSTANTGQSCMSLERVYVEEAVAGAFVDLLVAKAERVGLAVPGPEDGDLGPFIDPRQADVVTGHLDDAVRRGASVLCGGRVEWFDGRPFMRPTVLTGVDHSMVVMTEETFGPLMPVMTVPDVDTAVRLANETAYGLSAAVFAGPGQGEAIAARLLCGGVSINDVCLTGLVPEGEKQAFKSSGLGPSRMGPASVRRFLRQRVLLERAQPQIQAWWYPA